MKLRELVFGARKSPLDPKVFEHLALAAFLAWVGLGADGLSSSAYGPEEAFRTLGEHRGLAVFLAVAMAATVFVISYGYSRIIEQFPSGGGGYLVTSKILGVLAAGHVSTGLYEDVVVETADGWRICHRSASRRRDQDLATPPRMPPNHP